MSTSVWSNDRVDYLKTLWAQGLSATEVAGRLGAVTRNAVLGKLHRLGLLSASAGLRPSRRCQIARPKRVRPQAAAAVATIADEEPAPFLFADGKFVTLRTVSDQMCRWPQGDPEAEDFHLCGHTRQAGSCYCGVHTRRAHKPGRVKGAKAALPVAARGGQSSGG